ncbi:transcriptional regulator, GntR family [Deinococcus reticulitermitis]|uniref:Transcriptional regulator, GntR family n=1 Tax=Deinococcus reticulitermitis TaxID=856736 RepID=A0A1H6VH10_9DEIO|nr:PLP-dependent aminotransferase family protein [Deinococcus reticulitermitis]SEJ03868.1 transcriptional regulator, GntR family [Deinococcus reticulitermitis]
MARTLREAVARGHLPEGGRLPGHRALAGALGVSRNTLVAALAQLESEGYVQARGRSGTRVVTPPLAAPGAPPPLPLSAWARRALAGGVADSGGEFEFDFRAGQPVPELYPARAWAQALARRAGAPTPHAALRDPLGPLDTRRALCAFLNAERGARVTPDMLLLTGGTQSSLDALARVFLEEGRLAVTEDPTYPSARAALAASGAEVQGVRVDGGGLVPSELPARATLLYLTPGCQYPTTAALSAARRQAVLGWARGCGAFILEDDYAADLHFLGRAPAVMQGQAPGEVILLGSFSKSLAPVTRSGFVAAPPEVTELLARTRPLTDRVPGVLDALALADVLASGAYSRHLRGVRQMLAHRAEVLLTALAEHLPAWPVVPARAGLHLYVPLPGEAQASETVRRAAHAGVGLSAGDGGAPSVLLAFAHLSPETLRRGVRRLAQALA